MDRLRGYRSDSGEDDISIISDEETDEGFVLPEEASSSERPSKAKFKVAMKTILKALDYDDEVADKMKKAKEDVGINAREVLAVLPLPEQGGEEGHLPAAQGRARGHRC